MFRSLLLRCVILALSMIGLFSLTQPAYAWWPWVHEDMIKKALEGSGLYSDNAINMMVYGSDETDLSSHPFLNWTFYPNARECKNTVLEIAMTASFNPPKPPNNDPNTDGFHFDNLMNFTEVQQRWNEIRAWVIERRPQTADSAAIRRWELLDGMVFHAIGDFYCHSNWTLLVGHYGAESLADPEKLPTWDDLFGSHSADWKAHHDSFDVAWTVAHLTGWSSEATSEFEKNGDIIPGLRTGTWPEDSPGNSFPHREPGSRCFPGRAGVRKAFPGDVHNGLNPVREEYDVSRALARRAILQWAQFKDSLLSSYPMGILVQEALRQPGGTPKYGADTLRIKNYCAVMGHFITPSCDSCADVANISGDGGPPESVYMFDFKVSDVSTDSTLTPAFACYAADTTIWPAILDAADPIGVARAYVAAGQLIFRGRAACEGYSAPHVFWPDPALSGHMVGTGSPYTIIADYNFDPSSAQGWTASDPLGYAGLESGLQDKDPCADNFGTQVVFFIGSPYPSTSYPGLYDTPFELPPQNERMVSPVIDLNRYSTGKNDVQDAPIPPDQLPTLGGCYLQFTVYNDLPLDNLVFYTWHVRNIVDGHAGQWLDHGLVYYGRGVGSGYDYETIVEDISTLMSSDSIQVALGVIDMSYLWKWVYGSGALHTPAPWFDDVVIKRFERNGPQWNYRDLDLFQDNFPGPDSLESWVRADMAQDINSIYDPVIRPGDSIVVTCASPLGGGGLATDPSGGPAVYLHVKCSYIGYNNNPPKPPYIDGPQLEGTYGTWRNEEAVHWNIIKCDSARTRGFVTPDAYCVDLNDSLFTRGYQIDYYFTARDNLGNESALPGWCRSQGPYFEFTCLPTENSDVLLVNVASGRGSFRGVVEDYWQPVFDAVLDQPNNMVDVYDVNAATSLVSNGLASRAVLEHLCMAYSKIIWDCGDLEYGTIGDGSSGNKSDDADMLINWMDISQHRVGLWVCGDDVANSLKTQNLASGLALMQQWCGVDVVSNSYFEVTGGRTGGGVITPLVTGDLADLNLYQHAGVAYKWYVFGGCPIISNFDVLEKTGTGKIAATYPAYQGNTEVAAVGNLRTNSTENTVRTMWFGFSYMEVRDDVRQVPEDRFQIAAETFAWMQNLIKPNVSQSDVPPPAYKLAQNFPNPFNPSTTIKFDMKAKGHVTLKIYNVAGQLVRTLVDGVKDVGQTTAYWDGKNDRGGAVASGIYFCRMEAGDYRAMKKIVLLR